MKILTESTIKLEEFNDSPGKERFLTTAKEILSEELKNLSFADALGASYFENTGSTVVIAIESQLVNFSTGIKLGQLALRTRADELHMIPAGNGTILVRFWWD